MADIATYTIGQEPKFGTDYIYNATALPNATTATSAVFDFGKVQSGVELVITADTEIVNAGAITFELLQDAAEDGSFTTTKVISTIAAGTQAIGTELVRYVSDKNTLQFCKVKITTVDDLQLDTITGYIRYISR